MQHIIIGKKMPVGSIREWTWRDIACVLHCYPCWRAPWVSISRGEQMSPCTCCDVEVKQKAYLIFSNMCRCQHVTCDQQWTLLQLTPITVKLWSRLLLTRIGRRRVLKRCLSLAPLVHLSNEMWTVELKSLNILLVILNGKLLLQKAKDEHS